VTDLSPADEAELLFEFSCLPLLGESIVAWVNGNTEQAGLSVHIGGAIEREVPWSALRYRKGLKPGVEPEYVPLAGEDGKPRRPAPGDICRVEGDPPGPRIWKEPE
jgi:hypothetical protein